jgi:hypothetical protein
MRVESVLRLPHDPRHDRGIDHRKPHRKSLRHTIDSVAFGIGDHHLKPD